MADENNAGAVAEVAVTETPVKVKKTRGPNKPKAAAEPAKAAPVKAEVAPAKAAPVQRRKRGETEAVASTTAKDTIKASAPKKVAKPAQSKPALAKTSVAKSPASTGDEFADLIKLEEENKTLRKALADKLRQENADLRKRLGSA